MNDPANGVSAVGETLEALSAEELVLRHIQKREREWRRIKRLLVAATLTGVAALVVASLTMSYSLRGRVGEGAASSSARVLPALTKADRAVILGTKADADSSASPRPAARQSKSVDAIGAPEPSPPSGPSVLEEPAPTPPKGSASAVPGSDAAPPIVPGEQPQLYSGVLVDVSADAQTITIEEIAPRTDPGSGPHFRTLRLTSRTAITLAPGPEETPSGEGLPDGPRRALAQVTDLRPGDFVAVTGLPLGGEIVAESVAIRARAAAPLPDTTVPPAQERVPIGGAPPLAPGTDR
jgi:hypothetical protein